MLAGQIQIQVSFLLAIVHLISPFLSWCTEVLSKQAWRPKSGAKVDPNLVRLLTSTTSSAARSVLFEYFLVLAACNTVVPTRVKRSASGQLEMEAVNSNEEGTGSIEYQGESPDEQALVAAAAAYGFTLLERTSGSIVIDVLGNRERQVLYVYNTFRVLGFSLLLVA